MCDHPNQTPDYRFEISPEREFLLMVTQRSAEHAAFGVAAGAFFSEPLCDQRCRSNHDGRSARRGRASGLPC